MAYRKPPHITVLERWKSQLIHSIVVKDVLASLMSAGYINMRDMERISIKCDKEGQTSASETLMVDVLLRNPDPDCFKHFTDAMEFSKREYVAQLLRQEYSQILEYEHNRVIQDRAEAARRGQEQVLPEYNDYQVSVAGRNEGFGQVSGKGQHGTLQMQTIGQSASDAQDLGATNIAIGQAQGGETMDYRSKKVAMAAGQRMALLVEQQREQELWRNLQIQYPPNFPLLAHLATPALVPCISKEDLKLDFNQRLGRGSFGCVFRGVYSGTAVAVKEVVLNINKRNQKKTRQDLQEEYLTHEFQVSAYIRHPNSTLLMAYAIELGSLYLVYEFIDGHNLQQIIFDPDVEPLYRLGKKEKFCLMIQMVQVMAFLHLCNPKIIHGDIKPNNMMVTRDKTQAKLCDLGLNKLKAKDALTTTRGNVLPGTPLYMAREQVLEKKPCSTRTDIWSMGASMYEVFFEEEVWEVENRDSTKEMVKLFEASKKPKLVVKPDERYSYVAELIGRCMHTFDENRPNALEVLKELRIQETKFLQSLQNTGMRY